MNRIMTVDDSRIIRKIVGSCIEALGFEVLEAEDGQQCLETLRGLEQEVKLILLDWNMPNMDGLTTLNNLKANPETAHIPVMMVTTESERSRMVDAIRSGAAQYLAKPFSDDELITKMMECLQESMSEAF